MKGQRKIILFIFLFVCVCVRAQVSGVVVDEKGEPLMGANVYWAGTTVGVATDFEGQFTLMPVKTTNRLVTSFVGCHNDTVTVTSRKPLTIVMIDEAVLDEVVIMERKQGVTRLRESAFDMQSINGEELCRAACCNLSEAFETNASVDVAYADAATGAKQIRLLGLNGTYVQLLQENTPAVRGLAQSLGMEYIPGPWMGSIQVSKGTSSVINGYEAISGQINVELLKPNTQNPLSLNLMVNTETMAEANIMGGWQIPLKEHEEAHHVHDDHCHHESLYTGILAHYGGSFMTMDENKDSFADMPKIQNGNLSNRWFYRHGDYTFQAFVRGLFDRRRAGQMNVQRDHAPSTKDSETTDMPPYRINLNTWRVEGFMKNGYVFDDESGSSVAVITAVSYHDIDNSYGPRIWKADQLNAYLNAICQLNWEGAGLIDNDHRLSTGLSLNYDKYGETLSLLPDNMNRQELTPGIFAEYSYTYSDKLSLVAGVRGDYSTRHGLFFTPRANVRYSPWKWWTLRASAGMGYRTPNVIADNTFLLPSSRVWKMSDDELRMTDDEGWVKQERAVNAGFSTTFYIPLGSRELQLSGEYYYTHFLHSVIVDMDRDPHAVYLYNQSDVPGARSFAHCAQIEATMEVLRGWTWTAAFRWTDVEQTTYDASAKAFVLRPKALSNRFKGIISTSYQTPLKKWQFDVTAQFNGVGRMPDGFTAYGDLAGGYGTPKPLKWYPQLMAQITKYFRHCSLYVGAENMTNFKQDTPIIDSFHPYSSDFDASMVLGPTMGWKAYIGFRYDLEKKE